jgi:hypothetical protein
MRNRIDIDSKHSRAIVQEIGERLRAFLQEEPVPPESLRTHIDRLRELEEQSPSIIPATERWPKRRHWAALDSTDGSADMDEQCHRW